MSNTKVRPPLAPTAASYVGLARIAGAEAAPGAARHLLRWPSRSRPGKEHFSSCDERGGDVRCTCEAWTYRGACGHAAGHLDALAHHGVTFGPPPADPGGAVGGAPETAGLTACEDAARDTPALDAVVERLGNPWLVSRGHAGVSLTCTSCRRVRRFDGDGAACWSITGGWRCGCGGWGPSPPAQGAARKPLQDHLSVLYDE